MPPFVPLADGAQVQLVYTLGTEVVSNRLWFVSRQPPIDQTTIDALATGVADHFSTQLMPFLSSDLFLSIAVADDWTADPSPFQGIGLAMVSGGNASGSHSANVSIRVRFNGASDQTFRDNSNFTPGIPKDQVVLNRYSDEIKDGIFECYVNLIDAAAGFGVFPAWRWVITSRQLDNAWRTDQAFSRTDIILFPSPYVSPRRHRLPP